MSWVAAYLAISLVLLVVVLPPLLGWIFYRLDWPQTEEAWQEELAAYDGLSHRFIAHEYKVWRKHHARTIPTNEGLSSDEDFSADKDNRGGRGSEPVTGDEDRSRLVLLAGSGAIRGRDGKPSHGVSHDSRPEPPDADSDSAPSGCESSLPGYGPGGGERPESDRLGPEQEPESFEAFLERRGKELGV